MTKNGWKIYYLNLAIAKMKKALSYAVERSERKYETLEEAQVGLNAISVTSAETLDELKINEHEAEIMILNALV